MAKTFMEVTTKKKLLKEGLAALDKKFRGCKF